VGETFRRALLKMRDAMRPHVSLVIVEKDLRRVTGLSHIRAAVRPPVSVKPRDAMIERGPAVVVLRPAPARFLFRVSGAGSLAGARI